MRITLSTSDTAQRIVLYNNQFLGNIVNKYGSMVNQAISSSGTSFSITGYNQAPAVTVTCIGNNYIPYLSNKTKDGFDVYLKDSGGTLVSGNVDIIIMGV